MKRLWGSVVGVLVLASVAPPAADAAESTADSPRVPEVEAVVGVGDASGMTGFGCGAQQTRVRYVVSAVEVRHSNRRISDQRGAGFTILGGVAMAGGEEVVTELAPESPVRKGFDQTVGAHFRVGHHERWVGAEGGVGVIANFSAVAPGDDWVIPFPDVRFSVGPRDRLHLFLGLGNSQPSSLGLGVPYGGVGFVPVPKLRLEGRFALESAWATAELRGDLTCYVQVAPNWSLRGGFGVGQSMDVVRVDRMSGEGNLGVVFSP